MSYYGYYKTPQQAQAERKNRRLEASLDNARDSFCGIGTRLVKLMLNRLAKTDDVAAAYRLALEIEDVNINAKKYFGEYKRSYYNKKEELICQLVDMCETKGYNYGKHDQIDISTNFILFFDLPGCEQISWHTNASCARNCPSYDKQWDGIPESTLLKLEEAICGNYTEDILKSAKKNNKDVEKQVLSIKEVYLSSYQMALDNEKAKEIILEDQVMEMEAKIPELKEKPFYKLVQERLGDKVLDIQVSREQGEVRYVATCNNTTRINIEQKAWMSDELEPMQIIKHQDFKAIEMSFGGMLTAGQALDWYHNYSKSQVNVYLEGKQLKVKLDEGHIANVPTTYNHVHKVFKKINEIWSNLKRDRKLEENVKGQKPS